ncbi:MAG: fatty acid desaturase, partial [Nostocales cyanobacterium 94392]|nr:fatty acid desaturase [Nostocales cyanobacterium 94392]
SYHTEHHVFPTINSDYYPLVQQLLIEKFPEKLNLIPIQEAWRLMLQTPIHYKDETTFTDTLGTQLVTRPKPCLTK